MICVKCNKRQAIVFVQRSDGANMKSEGYCLTCAKELGIKPVEDMMKQFGIRDEDLEGMEERFQSMMGDGGLDGMMEQFGGMPGFAQQMQEMENDEDDGEDDFSPGGSPAFPLMFGMGTDASGNPADMSAGPISKNAKDKKKDDKKDKGRQGKRKFLDNYCENLTQKARDGKLDNIIGRDREIYRTIQILSRRQKNNPCLIGEAGVGKTAIAEGIAEYIVAGNVPARLKDREIYLLDLTALVAGTQFRGQFESRVKGLIGEVKAAGNIILFIDEIHNITGAGDSEGAMNAANILKPALSRGEIQVIGATTFAEYRKYIEKDQALERRFQPVKVEEPSIEDTISVMRGIKAYYEKHHYVKVPDTIIEMTVRMSERYITDRFLPDKAIDLLDEACACCSLAHPEITTYVDGEKMLATLNAQLEEEEQETEEMDYQRIAELKTQILHQEQEQEKQKVLVDEIEVSTDDLAKVIELWTGIPALKIQQSEFTKLTGLAHHLKEHIIGQDEAVELVAAAIKRNRAGIASRRRPASFIFVGPTG
ncbi:MAG: ATP-dependent Clp protease ATP-binding subunit, partial [Oscillospiraceae bacterium]|nr:ATP-dependent Clp protease ATP-binding subunit [Oscillospiraceae bacterium]